MIATCSPSDGSLISLGETVSCQFLGNGGRVTFNDWGASLSLPFQSTSQSQVFTSVFEGTGEITISWVDSSGAINYESFTYQIGSNTAIASCTPGTGSTIELFTYVTCEFTGSATFEGWNGGTTFMPCGLFIALPKEGRNGTNMGPASLGLVPGCGSTVQTFEATSTGSGSITAFWSVTSQSGPTFESFAYTISPSTSIASCSPGNGASIQLGSTVTCDFIGGGTFISWVSSLFKLA